MRMAQSHPSEPQTWSSCSVCVKKNFRRMVNVFSKRARATCRMEECALAGGLVLLHSYIYLSTVVKYHRLHSTGAQDGRRLEAQQRLATYSGWAVIPDTVLNLIATFRK